MSLAWVNKLKQKDVEKEIKRVKQEISREISDGAGASVQSEALLAELQFKAGHYQEAAQTYEAAANIASLNCLKYGVKEEGSMRDVYLKKADEIYEHMIPEKRSADHRHRKNLATKLSPAAAIIGLFGAIFFFSANMTGNVIGNITNSTSNILGVVFILIALVGGFFWFKGRR